MNDIDVRCSNERKSWNVFLNGEWYFEGSFEEAQETALNLMFDESEDTTDAE